MFVYFGLTLALFMFFNLADDKDAVLAADNFTVIADFFY